MSGLIAQARATETDSYVTVDPHVCKRLQTSQGASYTPGVDVHGRPVTPSDIQSERPFDMKTLTIPLAIDVAPYAGGETSALAETTKIGEIELDILSGQLSFNGKPLSESDIVSVQQACDHMD